jgi:hypothetical protein
LASLLVTNKELRANDAEEFFQPSMPMLSVFLQAISVTKPTEKASCKFYFKKDIRSVGSPLVDQSDDWRTSHLTGL